jgi:N6-adenosine-specific RNA methylase IME4
MEAHSATNLFPMMPQAELVELAKDIKERGQMVPIVVYQGKILDGRNRWAACEIAGVEPRTMEWQGTGSPTAWVISLNLHRRHLTPSQRAAIAVDALPVLEAEARKRQGEAAERTNSLRRELKALNEAAEKGDSLADWKASLISRDLQRERNRDNARVYFIKSGGRIKIGHSIDPAERLKRLQLSDPDAYLIADFPGGTDFERMLHNEFHEHLVTGEWYEDIPAIYALISELDALCNLAQSGEDALHAKVEASKVFKVSPRYVMDAKRIKQEAPDLYEHVRQGDASLQDAKRTLKERKREVVREQNRELVQNTAPVVTAAKPQQRFTAIVLDPPWDWGDEGDADQFGRARPTYATMTIDEIAALPIGQLAADNAHIYLWITNRSLPKGFDLLARWGFRYVTCVTWVKPSIGMGNYFRGSTEHILFGVRGSLSLLRQDIGTHFTASRPGKHSEKPDAFYALVESCSPGPWLEVFSRKQRTGWVAWGAEIGDSRVLQLC